LPKGKELRLKGGRLDRQEGYDNKYGKQGGPSSPHLCLPG
jgi:hypothetical protein